MRVLDKVELCAVAGGTLPPSDHDQPPGPMRTFEWPWSMPDFGSTYVFEIGADKKTEVPPKSGETAKDWFSRAEKLITEALNKAKVNASVTIKYENIKPSGEQTRSSIEVKANNGTD